MPTTKEVVRNIEDYVNSYSDKSKEFCEEMSMAHRTLQQSFTKLCFQWLEYVASDEYRTDGRNIASKDISKICLESFKEYWAKQGFTNETLEILKNPSGHLPMV